MTSLLSESLVEEIRGKGIKMYQHLVEYVIRLAVDVLRQHLLQGETISIPDLCTLHYDESGVLVVREAGSMRKERKK